MKNNLLAKSLPLVLFGGLVACQPKVSESPSKVEPPAVKIEYPITVEGEVVDTYFENQVADPYRWLEDDRSAETEAWVSAQNQTTQAFLKGIPYREKIADVVRNLLNYERISAPFKEGQYTYYYKNDGLQNQSVVYRQKGTEEAEIFIDPNTFSDDGTVSLAALSFLKMVHLQPIKRPQVEATGVMYILSMLRQNSRLEIPLSMSNLAGYHGIKMKGFTIPAMTNLKALN
jgi:prolyl oligopeptidase